MKLNKLAYSFAIICQLVLITLEYLSAIMIVLIDPVRLNNFLSNSKINLTLLNKALLSVMGILNVTPLQNFIILILTGIFGLIMVNFVIIKPVWLEPSKETAKLTVIATVSTFFFCLFVANYWQIYTNFM